MRAFDAYYDVRKEVHGESWPAKHYAEHRSWKAFMKCAADCEAAGRDVVKYVETVLRWSPKNSCEIVPNDLNGKAAHAIWAQHGGKPQVMARDMWANQTRVLLQMQRASGQSDEAILISGFNTQFSAWFRVFYPEKLSAAILEKFGEDAVEELKKNFGLVRFLRAVMPAKVEEFERRMGVVDGLLA